VNNRETTISNNSNCPCGGCCLLHVWHEHTLSVWHRTKPEYRRYKHAIQYMEHVKSNTELLLVRRSGHLHTDRSNTGIQYFKGIAMSGALTENELINFDNKLRHGELPEYKVICTNCFHAWHPRSLTSKCPKCKNKLSIAQRLEIDKKRVVHNCKKCGHEWTQRGNSTPPHRSCLGTRRFNMQTPPS
jgi:Zn finger protein HypA/HybF involved in hydrogenase expression